MWNLMRKSKIVFKNVLLLKNTDFKNTQGADVSTELNQTDSDIVIRKGLNCDVST